MVCRPCIWPTTVVEPQRVVPFAFTANPDAVVNGVDLDSAFQFTRQWNFNLAASYSNGHLTGSSIPCSPPSGGTTPAAFPPGTHVFLCPSHASVSTTPNFTMTPSTEYDMPCAQLPGLDAFIRGLYTFYGRNPHASQYYVTPSYGMLNLYVGLRSSDGAWEGSLFAKNALDTKRMLSTSIGTPAINPRPEHAVRFFRVLQCGDLAATGIRPHVHIFLRLALSDTHSGDERYANARHDPGQPR